MPSLKLNTMALGISLGIIWSLSMLVTGLSAWIFGWGDFIVEFVSRIYIGFAPSFFGSVIGAIWAFIDGFIGGFLIAWIYNKFSK